MANTTEDCINQMSREGFFQYAIDSLKDMGICGPCNECRLDYRYFREKFGISDFIGRNYCGDVIGYIGERLEKELVSLKPAEPEKKETGNCSSCTYYKDYSGTGFCEIWHNFTQPYVYCSYHSAKEAET